MNEIRKIIREELERMGRIASLDTAIAETEGQLGFILDGSASVKVQEMAKAENWPRETRNEMLQKVLDQKPELEKHLEQLYKSKKDLYEYDPDEDPKKEKRNAKKSSK